MLGNVCVCVCMFGGGVGYFNIFLVSFYDSLWKREVDILFSSQFLLGHCLIISYSAEYLWITCVDPGCNLKT